MTTKTTTKAPTKTVRVEMRRRPNNRGRYETEDRAEAIDRILHEHIAEGWTLFNMDTFNEPCSHGTGNVTTLITFIR